MNKIPYPCEYTADYEFIQCSKGACHILKRFRIFKSPAILLIWYKSSYKHSITWSHRSGKGSGRRSGSPLWRHQWRSFIFISHADNIKREIRVTVVSLWEARVSTERTWCYLSLVPPEHLKQPHTAKFMGSTWGPPGPHVGPMNLAIRGLVCTMGIPKSSIRLLCHLSSQNDAYMRTKQRHHWFS